MPLVGLQDTYRTVLHGVLGGQEVSNVFHFHRSSIAGTAAGLSSGFITNVVPVIQTIMSSAVQLTTLDIVNIEDPDDSSSAIVNAPGLRAADMFSTFAAWGFRLIPSVASLQTGSKRFAGVSEADVNDGVAVASQLLRLAIVATRLQTPFVQSLVNWTPVIYSDREILGIPFRRVATISTAAYNWVTTQNSRKVGRGS